MSCQHDQHYRFKLGTLTSVIALLLSNNVYAVTINSSNTKSTQHQPLSATIDVSDIKDINNFRVALANQQIYQQMGLNFNPTMSVSFVKTSTRSGKIILNTAEPLSEAFADIVLTVNDAGTQIIVPKTLLLPLGGAIQPTIMSTQSTDNKDLSATAHNDQQSELILGQPILGQPLPINRSLPPPLRILSVTPKVVPEMKATAKNSENTIPNLAVDNLRQSNDISAVKSIDNIETLKINVRRSYRPHVHKNQNKVGNNESILVAQQSSNSLSDHRSTAKVTDTAAVKIQTKVTKIEPHIKTAVKTDSKVMPDIALGTHTYTVQENDNLWTIANQLAKENNLKIQTVIQQIKAYNPSAFADGDISKLKANSTLRLPAYETIPSKLGINAAIADRKSQQTEAATVTRATEVTNNQQSSIGAKLNNELHNKSHSTRHLTASNRHNVKIADKQFSGSSNRMAIQNQRLADLEKRFKALRNK